MAEREQWPPSYLNSFEPFVSDPRSVKCLKAHLDRFAQGLLDKKGLRMMDVCCGTGIAGRLTSSYLGSLGCDFDLILLDKSPVILAEIETRPRETKISADVTDMPQIKDSILDLVVCRYGFNNLPQEKWLKALSEVLRVLKPGGYFLLQDHFVPGPTFSALVNEAEQFLARLEGKKFSPFIFSTEAFNNILDHHPLVASRVKSGYGLTINIWERLKAKQATFPDFEAIKAEILRFYEDVCLKRFQVLIVNPDEYIPVNNVTYEIVKRK